MQKTVQQPMGYVYEINGPLSHLYWTMFMSGLDTVPICQVWNSVSELCPAHIFIHGVSNTIGPETYFR